MQRDNSRKIALRRRNRGAEFSHWLEQGAEGQAALFLDIDPYLLAVDQILASRVNQVAFRLRLERRKPKLVLVLPPNFVSWHLGFLSKQFQLFVTALSFDVIFEKAAAHFQATVVDSLDDLPDSSADLILVLDSSWNDESALLDGLLHAMQFLHPDGELLFATRGEMFEDGPHLLWPDLSTTSINKFALRSERLTSRLFRGVAVAPIHPGTLDNLGASFLKRHREFFGRDALLLFKERLRHGDFFEDVGSYDRNIGLLAAWGAAGSPPLS